MWFPVPRRVSQKCRKILQRDSEDASCPECLMLEAGTEVQRPQGAPDEVPSQNTVGIMQEENSNFGDMAVGVRGADSADKVVRQSIQAIPDTYLHSMAAQPSKYFHVPVRNIPLLMWFVFGYAELQRENIILSMRDSPSFYLRVDLTLFGLCLS